MVFQSPNLDDRRFEDLLAEAQQRIAQTCPGWTDLSESDPGMVLLQVFAYLTDIMIYRLNRIPEKAYIEFLRLIGLQLQPPTAACVDLRFSLAQAQARPVVLPRGTRVTTARAGAGTEPPVFIITETVTIEPGELEREVRAYHCEAVIAELAGKGTGLPGLTLTANRPPLVAATGMDMNLVVGVEATPTEIGLGIPTVQYEDKTYRLWREAYNFTTLGADRFVYIADRCSGRITFAPAARLQGRDSVLEDTPHALAEAPPAGREIRLWYCRGGGPEGNVAANTLVVLKDPISGVKVTNPQPATGGRSAETLANALIRGPQELHSLRRAVTARDFELMAVRSSGAVNRAKAFTQAQLWAHGQPGTVELILVPNVPDPAQNTDPVTVALLQQEETEPVLQQIQAELELRRPLGTSCVVNWARYKTVRVKARVVLYREQDPSAVKAKVLRNLYKNITPLAAPPAMTGWPFGQSLSVSDVYRLIGSQPGIRSIDKVRLLIDQVPGKNVRTLSSDAFQSRAWYAGADDSVFRSLDDGDGWELIGRFPTEQIDLLSAYPRESGGRRGRAGLLAVVTRLDGEKSGSKLRLSRNCGETWEPELPINFLIQDIAWAERGEDLILFLATERGLYELSVLSGPAAVPQPILIDPRDPALGFYAVAVSYDVSEGTSVAAAAQKNRGVFLSSEGGKSNSFQAIGLEGELLSVLSVQHIGPHRFLWAGIAAPANDNGKGCFRWRLTGSAQSPEGWRPYQKNWQGGSCHALAFQGSQVYAATFRAGALWLDGNDRDPAWQLPDANCGLPLRDIGRFQPVVAIVSKPDSPVLLGGGAEGIYRRLAEGGRYERCSQTEFLEAVTLPTSWLWCSGEHDITVVTENEANSD